MADFPDQAGVMLPIKDDAVIEQMGDECEAGQHVALARQIWRRRTT